MVVRAAESVDLLGSERSLVELDGLSSAPDRKLHLDHRLTIRTGHAPSVPPRRPFTPTPRSELLLGLRHRVGVRPNDPAAQCLVTPYLPRQSRTRHRPRGRCTTLTSGPFAPMPHPARRPLVRVPTVST